MPATTVTTLEASKAAQMYREGYSQEQIAQALGRSRNAARTALRYAGVRRRSRSEALREWHRLRDASLL